MRARSLEHRLKKLEQIQNGVITERARQGADDALRVGLIHKGQCKEFAKLMSQPGFWSGIVRELTCPSKTNSGLES